MVSRRHLFPWGSLAAPPGTDRDQLERKRGISLPGTAEDACLDGTVSLASWSEVQRAADGFSWNANANVRFLTQLVSFITMQPIFLKDNQVQTARREPPLPFFLVLTAQGSRNTVESPLPVGGCLRTRVPSCLTVRETRFLRNQSPP